ncbi:type ISP restriction/modification enzyme [Bernardetia sp. OM2101]|uniref:type ISP restriction/modification enzyme n=1 Tax=Bernardetia sp. OM2101 TaxID=3344876 RepID=UPI0035D0AC41
MNSPLFNFCQTYFPSLYLVQFSAMEFQIWDNQNVIWAKIEVEKNKLKIISIQQKSIILTDFEELNKEEIKFLEELNNLSIEFYQKIKPLSEQAKKDSIVRKKEIENQFRKGFSAGQKEDLQPIIQLLEEGGHSVYLISEWIAIFEFWKVIYEKSNFKKSFFQRQEILKSLTNFLDSFYNNSQKSNSQNKIPASYLEIESFVTDFSQKNKIKETEILLYGILNEFLNDSGNNTDSKLGFSPRIQQNMQEKISQIESKNKKIWVNDNLILKALEFNSEEFKKKTLFGTFECFADLLLAFSTQNETSQFAFAAKKPISQVGIFGLSKNSELVTQINTESNYDLIILDLEKQNLHSIKEISLFQSLSKQDKQLFNSIQNGFKSLSENGILFILLNENQNNFIEKKSLSSLRRLLQEWFERIEIYQNKNEIGIIFYKKTEAEKGIFYSELDKAKSNFESSFIQNTWKPKPVLPEYQKLIPAINLKQGKNAIFKTHFRAIPTQKIESFIEVDSNDNSKNNLKVKVNDFIQNYNQEIEKSEEQEKSKLEKKKNVLVSKLAANTLFEKDTIKVIEEKIEKKVEVKINQKIENKSLEFNEKNLIKTQISVFEDGFWYYEKLFFEQSENQYTYDLDKIFPNRKKGENILVFWTNTENGGEIWATDRPVPPSFLNAILPNAYIFPFYIYDQIEEKTENGIRKKVNFSKTVLQKFRRGYAAAFEKRIEKVEDAIQVLFDLSDFEFLQVNQELAFELRALSNIVDKDEFKMTRELIDNLHHPETNTYIQFEQIVKVFTTTKRTFERLENKATRNKESHETLQNYFKKGEKAIDFIENYWQKLETEEAEDFVVPTEENMTEKLILGYIFAVWQRDLFKSKYKEELKNEPPRIPIYKDFHHFANQGEFLLQKFLREPKHKIEFEIVEVFEEEKAKNEPKKTAKKSKNWFEKENKIWFDKTTFLQPILSELDFEKIKEFKINEKPFLELTLTYLRKNKIDLNEGKDILERIINFIIA